VWSSEVGDGITDVQVGDLVACAGNEHALHAELNWVPKNLYAASRPGSTRGTRRSAPSVSIAMQGVRRGEPQLGDVALVIGLGLIGQLVVQLLSRPACGRRRRPDPDRCKLAEKPRRADLRAPGVRHRRHGRGRADPRRGRRPDLPRRRRHTNDPVELAAKLARDRGRVVDIGKCKLDLPWNAYYEKELDVRFSRSYGPGRYDPSYELEGATTRSGTSAGPSAATSSASST
jgi:hypothetical protein